MTQPGSDEMVYRVLLEHASNSALSSAATRSSNQSETNCPNSASDMAGNESDRCPSFLSMESGRATSQDFEQAAAKYLGGAALDLARYLRDSS